MVIMISNQTTKLNETLQHTCDVEALSEVEVCDARAGGDHHEEAGVVQGGALGHVEVGQGQGGASASDVD